MFLISAASCVAMRARAGGVCGRGSRSSSRRGMRLLLLQGTSPQSLDQGLQGSMPLVCSRHHRQHLVDFLVLRFDGVLHVTQDLCCCCEPGLHLALASLLPSISAATDHPGPSARAGCARMLVLEQAI
jgi:hypothetical protein